MCSDGHVVAEVCEDDNPKDSHDHVAVVRSCIHAVDDGWDDNRQGEVCDDRTVHAASLDRGGYLSMHDDYRLPSTTDRHWM